MPHAEREDIAMESPRQCRTVRSTLSVPVVVVRGLPVPLGKDLVGYVGERLVVIRIQRTLYLALVQNFRGTGGRRNRITIMELKLLGGRQRQADRSKVRRRVV